MQRCDPWRIKFAYGKRTITVLGVSTGLENDAAPSCGGFPHERLHQDR
ncbi:MAG: hypothetical protein F6K65_07915 [Moorea sp. SIO3C2]|nr:hypothetical protein [Moorena sp. SIO3C2]